MATPATEDRISSLLDEIICHILSFIPTKHAVATSVLSKRWKHLWRSIPLLDFTDYDLEDMDSILRFNHFVYSVLLSREAARNLIIDSFILDLAYADPNHINSLTIPNLTTWLNHVVQRRVKNLHLLLSMFTNVDYDDDNDPEYVAKLPNIIFSCKTLVVLNLAWFSVKGFSFSSAGFEFPLLKTLHLNYIDFPQHRDFMLLLARCPILEDFKVSHVFVYDEVQEFQDLSLSKLIRADIASCYRSFPIKALFNSKFLTIQLNKAYTPYDFPNFHNLTHLVINNDWDLVVQVLHHCPKLQNLDLHQIQEKWVEPKSAPQCISLYLRTCTIRDFPFVGLQRHIMLARYILQNARVLQTMTIWSGGNQHEIEKKLSSCPRASVTCKLSVY